jgi:hypothetical protein
LTYNESANDALYDYGVNLNHAYDRILAIPGTLGSTIKTTQISEGAQVCSGGTQ